MKTEQQTFGSVDVITPVGALVGSDASEFTELILDKLRASNPRVVVDLHQVPYIDSAGLEGLLQATEDLGDRAMNLTIARVTSSCREAVELTGLAPRFRWFEDIQTAVRSFI